MPSLGQIFLAHPGGALGETSALALLLGGGYLLYKKHIDWHIPVSIIGTVAVMALLFGKNPLYHILVGGVLLGAIFMATDWVTSPVTPKGKIIFGICIGVLLMLFRLVWPPRRDGFLHPVHECFRSLHRPSDQAAQVWRGARRQGQNRSYAGAAFSKSS